MRFLDTERLLPDPNYIYVKGTNGTKFKTAYNETDLDTDIELGYACNGVSPFYMASALYATDRITSEYGTNMINPQIAPYINEGITPGSYASLTTCMTKYPFYGTYYFGWRNTACMGTVVPNPVGGHPFPRYDDSDPLIERAGKWRKKKNIKAAYFRGAWAAAESRRLYCTVCGYYGGLSNVDGYRKWGIGDGQETDGGLAFSRLAGYRTRWIPAIKRPYQLAKHIWKKASRILRAYTGFVAQTQGSSTYFSDVYMFANGCWEQVVASDPYIMGLEFSEHLDTRLHLDARGAANFHMVDLLDLKTNAHRLTGEIPIVPELQNYKYMRRWNGSHPEFFDNLYKIVDLEITSFNGDAYKGTVTRKIPYVDFSDEEQVGLLAKCRTFVGGMRSVLTCVQNGDPGDVHITHTVHESDAIFNASHVETPPAPHVPHFTRFWNLFVIEPPDDVSVNSSSTKTKKKKSTITTEQLYASRTAPPPVPRTSYHERFERGLSVETFPNADVKDDGLMPQVASVKVTNSDDAMQLTIVLADGSERSIGFMPVSALLIEDRDQVLASHNKVAAGNFGYGFVHTDPFSGEYGITVFAETPTVDQYAGQERWHVPYKDLIKRSWEQAVGPMISTGFSGGGTAKENPYIFKEVSELNPSNRYTLYDLQIRPPTFLPLFMAAAVCHEGGSTAFAGALALGIVESLKLTVSDTTVTFTQPAPSWVTDVRAFQESIITLLLLGGMVIDQYVDVDGSAHVVEYSNEVPFRGAPSDSFWYLLAEVSGLSSVSDLITHYGVNQGIANIPSSVLTAAAVKDPIAFGASMGVTVIRFGEGYLIGTRYYSDLSEVTDVLVDIARHVILVDKANVENITTALGIPEPDEVEAEPKRYAKPFNWLLLLPHVATAATAVATKATQKRYLNR